MTADVVKWVNVPWVFVLLFVLPGVVFVWIVEGSREKKTFIASLRDSLLYSLAIFTISASIVLAKVSHLKLTMDFFAGCLTFYTQGYVAVMANSAEQAFWVSAATLTPYMVAILMGLGVRVVREFNILHYFKGGRHKIIANSVLDVELLRLRRRKITPEIIVTMESGEKITGICHSYTFTEPREMALSLDSSKSADKWLIWVKLDAKVVKVEIVYTDAKKSSCRNILDKIQSAVFWPIKKKNDSA